LGSALRGRLEGDVGDLRPALAIGRAQLGDPHQHIRRLGPVTDCYAVVSRLQWHGWGQLRGIGQLGRVAGVRQPDPDEEATVRSEPAGAALAANMLIQRFEHRVALDAVDGDQVRDMLFEVLGHVGVDDTGGEGAGGAIVLD